MSSLSLKEVETAWKEKTNAANLLFNESQFKEALEVYKDALNLSEIINKNKDEARKQQIPFVQVYIISCNNYASTCKELNLPEKGEILLKRVIYFLLHLIEENEGDLKELHQELKRAMIAYSEYIASCDLDISLQEQVFADIQQALKTDDLYQFISF